jgi:hypothetical protein
MAERTGTWDGGYIHKDTRGRKVYVIRQQINGVRYEVGTRAFTERPALEQWKRFQSDPEGYDPNGGQQTQADLPRRPAHEGVPRLLARREAQQQAVARRAENPAGVVVEEAARHRLARGQPARLDPARAGSKTPSRQHKVTVIKGLYSWLRKVRREITLADDPTAAGMLVLPAPKKQLRRPHFLVVVPDCPLDALPHCVDTILGLRQN